MVSGFFPLFTFFNFRLACKYGRVLEEVYASFIESLPFRSMVIFTVFQVVYFLVCYGMTLILVAGILFTMSFFSSHKHKTTYSTKIVPIAPFERT
ncbi:putative bicarbonate transporter [Helianthus annuus]|uniref:Bicarbonate transporter n=1 Tax=Helianthus annuus TaxID=4232 RepID=A0A251U189_HELAN|nr:putative bicarbonate transporter [Helianthus annuus]